MANLNDHSSRDHALLSASSAHRWLNCPPSAIAAAAYEDEGSEFAAEGTLAHEVAEAIANRRTVSDRLVINQEMIDCAREYRDYIQEHIKSPTATVLLEQRVDFSPWVPEGFGTCDCIILQDDTMTVIDYKYGKGVAVDAENNPQLRLYALGALNDFGIAYDVTKVETHIFQPRINNVTQEALTADELLKWGDSIKPIAQKAAKGKGTYKAGTHCKFCPHAGKCRTLTALCTEKVQAYGISAKVPVLAPHEVAEVLELEPVFNLWLKNVKAQALQTLLDGGEVPGFKVVEGKLGNRKWTDELEVLNALLCSGYAKEDVTETKLLSPAGMDKAIGKKKVEELLEKLIDRAPGAPTIATATDKRPVYSRLAEAQKDFN
ncbi:MAG: DUF2800 domain-containing protein [Oscillospiraceae bacterium]|nr:DUF2800 domain-containing protein [Oscillospiraceae bacterium]